MKIIATLIMLFGIAASLIAQSSPPSSQKLDELKCLAGAWPLTANGVTTEEYWTAPGAGSMIGMGRTIASGKTVFFEYLRIEARPDGIVYVAHPKARPGTDFKLKSLAVNE